MSNNISKFARPIFLRPVFRPTHIEGNNCLMFKVTRKMKRSFNLSSEPYIFLYRLIQQVRKCHPGGPPPVAMLLPPQLRNRSPLWSFFIKKNFLADHRSVVSKSGNPGPGPVPNSYFLYYIFIKALILIKFEHNA